MGRLASVTLNPRALFAPPAHAEKKMITMIYRLTSVSLLLALSAPLVSAGKCDLCPESASNLVTCSQKKECKFTDQREGQGRPAKCCTNTRTITRKVNGK